MDTSDGVYLIFMFIGIVGYFTIPTVSNWVIQAGGGGNYMKNVGMASDRGSKLASAGAGAVVGNLMGRWRHRNDGKAGGGEGAAPSGDNYAVSGGKNGASHSK